MERGCWCHPPPGLEPGRKVRGSLSGHVHASEALVHAQAVLHVHLVLAAVLGRGSADGQRCGGTADLEEHPAGEGGGAGPRVSLLGQANWPALFASQFPAPVLLPPVFLAPSRPGSQLQALPLQQVPALACRPHRCPPRPWSSPRRVLARPRSLQSASPWCLCAPSCYLVPFEFSPGLEEGKGNATQ